MKKKIFPFPAPEIKLCSVRKETGFPAVETEKLTKIFKVQSSSIRALDEVSLKIFPNEIFVLLGKNGAGKTTLIKTLCTILIPDSGSARVFGHDTVQEALIIHPLLSLALGEERGFYWRLTGRQNLHFFAALYNIPKAAASSKIEELSSLFHINFLDLRYDQCSAGMKHRLALARCFLTDAQIIFMDEPTRSLDPAAKKSLQKLIKETAKKTGKTFFLTTHDLLEAESLADRVAILDAGRILAQGSPDELRKTAQIPGASLEKIFYSLTQTEGSHAPL